MGPDPSDLPFNCSDTTCVSHSNGIYLVGGISSHTIIKNRTQWYKLPDISVNRDRLPCVFLIENFLYIAAGYNNKNKYQLSTMESLDINNIGNGWQPSISMHRPLNNVVCATINRTVMLTGGGGAKTWLNRVIMWTVGNKGWTKGCRTHIKRFQACGVSDGVQFMYVFGGYDRSYSTLASTERYDIQKNSWAFLNPMPRGLSYHACLYIDGTIIVSGGFDGSAVVDKIYLYSVTSDNWIISSTHLIKPTEMHMLGLVLP